METMRLAVLALVACGSATTQESIDYVGGFAAQFPIPPTWHARAHGVLVEAHAVEDKKPYEFAVRYDDVAAGLPRDRAIEEARDAVLRGTKMPVASEVAASLGDVPGTGIVFTRRSGTAITRIFATATRVYEVSGAGPDKALVVQFLDSFRLVQ